MKKRMILGLLLALGMILGMSVMAQADPNPYNIWAGGEQFTSEHLTINGTSGGTATFDPNTNTLTLNNYKYTGTGHQEQVVNKNHTAAVFYNIISSTPLTIKLIGNNYIKQTGGDPVASDGLFVISNGVTIKGSGTLYAEGGNAGKTG